MVKEPVKFGDYYLFERVAVGGMAEVFKGVSYGVEGFERLFAVKRVLPSISEDQEFIEMFIDEAKIAVQLTHANIGQIFELGNAENSYFIAMEFVQGKDLRAIFDRSRSKRSVLDIPMCCHVVKEVCEALEYAHGKRNEKQEPLGLIHRDVSPQNILVSYDGEVKLIDFGIAKAAGKASKTQSGILKGKFGYMSPEQVRGKPIDRRSDLFSLAVVLFELLTLERCFQGESDFSTLEKVRNVDIRRPSALNRDIPPELERIVLKGLARNPEERYQTAAEFQDALQKFLYQSGAFYARKDLAAYMRRTFDGHLRDEASRLGAFREYARTHIPEARRASSVPDQPEAKAADSGGFKADLPALSWEEDEIATAVWDRSPSQIILAHEQGPPAAATPDPPAFANADFAVPEAAGHGSEPIVPALGPARVMPARLDVGPARGGPSSTHLVLPAAEMHARREVGDRKTTLLVVTLLAILAAGVAVFLMRPQGPTSASVTLRTQPPEVRVQLDGRAVYSGGTPYEIPSVPAGIHSLRVEADGYQPTEHRIQVDDQPVVIALELRKRTDATAIEVESRPGGATLFIDGQRRDQTPTRVAITPGQRTLRVEKDGFLPWEGTIEAPAGQLMRLDGAIRLYPAKVAMTFLPEPDTAAVSLVRPDGQRLELGVGPRTFEGLDNSGRLVVEATAPAHKTLRKRVQQTFDARASMLLRLEPGPARRNRPARRRPTRPSPRRAVAAPPGCRGEDCPPKTPKRVALSSQKPGFLQVTAKPAGQVYVGKRLLGWTPIVKHELPAGPYTVRVVRTEDPAYEKTMKIVIEPEQTNRRRIRIP